MNTDYEETEVYCSMCGVASNAPPDILCERHGKTPIPVTEERLRAIDISKRHAKATNKRWVVVFVPPMSFTACVESVLKSDPPKKPHMVSDVADPFYLGPRFHLSPARVTTSRPDTMAETPKIPGRTGTTR